MFDYHYYNIIHYYKHIYIFVKYIIILLSIIFLSMFSIINSANSNSLYESDFIKIEIKTNNAYETKLKSIEEIKNKSLLVIVDKILDDSNKRKFIKLLNENNFINELVQNIIIENEIITNQKYIAEIRVNFDKKRIINILRNYKINYSDNIPFTYLVISSYNQEFINIGLERNNIFFNKFKNNIFTNNYLLNYIFPILDPNDRYILSYDKMITEDKNAYRKLLDKYNIDQALYIKINHTKNKINFLIKSFDKNINQFIQIKQFEYNFDQNNNIDFINSLSEDILHELDDWWKKENQINNSIINSIKCTIKSANFDDFYFIKSTINNLSQVLTIKPIQFKINNNIEMIKYYGDTDMFSKSLYLKGITLEYSDYCVISSNL